MRNLNILLSCVTLLVILTVSGCKNDEAPAPTLTELREIELKSGSPWVLGSVIKDDLDVSNKFIDFSLDIADFSYTTTNSLKSAWPKSGSWQFQNDDPNLILRDDGTEIQVSISNGQLILSFTVLEGELGGKTTGFSGEYVFSLTAKN